MKYSMRYLFIINILTTFGILIWILLTPSLSSEIVLLTYSKNRLLMNTIAIMVLLLLLICLWTLRFQKAQEFFKKVFSSKLFASFFLFLMVIILQSFVFFLGGSFGGKTIYFEKLSPLIILFFLLSVEVLFYLYSSTNGEIFRSLSMSLMYLINRKTYLFIILILFTYLTIVFFSLTKGHNWGDDFAQYLLQSNSLLTGTVDNYIQGTIFTNINSSFKHSPTTVPWGFPIALLPFIKAFNQNILGLKLVNVVAYSAFLLILYKWSSKRLSKLASLLIFSFFAISPTFIQFHNQVITDLFFLLCSTMSILLIDIYISRPDKKKLHGILLGLSIFYASFTRMSGYFLLAALFFAQTVSLILPIFHKKKVEFAQFYIIFFPYLVFAFCFIVQSLVLNNFQETVKSVIDLASIETVVRNINSYFRQLSSLYSDLFFPTLTYLLTLPLIVIGIIVKRKSLTSWTVLVYAILTLCLYISFPGTNGLRYLFPIIPIYIVYVVLGISSVIAFFTANRAGIVTACLAFLCITFFTQYAIADVKYAIQNINADRIELSGPYSPKSIEMFDYIRNNTSSDSVIVFFRPRAMRYFTNRNSIFSDNCEGLEKGNYLVRMKAEEFRDNGLQINMTELNHCIGAQKLNLKYENDEIAIYKIIMTNISK